MFTVDSASSSHIQCTLCSTQFLVNVNFLLRSTRIQFQFFTLLDSYTVYWLLSFTLFLTLRSFVSHTTFYFLFTGYVHSTTEGQWTHTFPSLLLSTPTIRHPRGDTDSEVVAYLNLWFSLLDLLSTCSLLAVLSWIPHRSNDLVLLILKCLGFWLAISGHVVLFSPFSYALGRCMQQHLIW